MRMLKRGRGISKSRSSPVNGARHGARGIEQRLPKSILERTVAARCSLLGAGTGPTSDQTDTSMIPEIKA
jgi:hypothetical protein